MPPPASLISFGPFHPSGEALQVCGSPRGTAAQAHVFAGHAPIIQEVVQMTRPLSQPFKTPFSSSAPASPAPSASGPDGLSSGSTVLPQAVAICACCSAQETEAYLFKGTQSW